MPEEGACSRGTSLGLGFDLDCTPVQEHKNPPHTSVASVTVTLLADPPGIELISRAKSMSCDTGRLYQLSSSVDCTKGDLQHTLTSELYRLSRSWGLCTCFLPPLFTWSKRGQETGEALTPLFPPPHVLVSTVKSNGE